MTKKLFPKSATCHLTNWAGLIGFLSAFFWLLDEREISIATKVVIILSSWMLPIALLEWFHFNPLSQNPLFRFNAQPIAWKRCIIKLLGLFITLSGVFLFYWIPPEYHGKFYQPYWNILTLAAPYLLIATPFYIAFVDRIMTEPEDSYYQLGLWALRKHNPSDNRNLIQHSLGWLVKAYFLPLMLVYFSQNIQNVHPHWDLVTSSFHHFFNAVWDICFTIDLGIICVGYALTLKLFDSHIRSTEPTLFGWFVAVICYQPFNSLFASNYFDYNRDNFGWGAWLDHSSVSYVIWGCFILIAVIIYTLASITFGLRFSNLTHRGIITHGVYRYTKHPAYLSKNFSWWLVSIPFIVVNDNYLDALRNILMLVSWNFIYYLRAKTEERHLAQDPIYREYMQAIERDGIFARIKRVALRFKPT